MDGINGISGLTGIVGFGLLAFFSFFVVNNFEVNLLSIVLVAVASGFYHLIFPQVFQEVFFSLTGLFLLSCFQA